jgi:uncharacterized repeat protein (TIGR01451 family)
VASGGNAQFDITVTNTGAIAANGVGFTDNLPSFGGTWSIVSQTQTTTPPALPCTLSGSTLTCSGITLAATTGSYTVRVSSTTNSSVCGAVQNTANLSSPYSGSSLASVTVTCPTTRGQLAPTQTTCSAFANGTSADYTEVLAGLKGNKINNVAPGVFFYYVSVSAPGGAFTIDITEANNSPSTAYNFGIQQVSVYNGACTTTPATVTYSGTGNTQTKITVPAGFAAGTTLYIGVKYTTSTVVGLSSTPLPILYTYKMLLNNTLVAANTDALTLRVK